LGRDVLKEEATLVPDVEGLRPPDMGRGGFLGGPVVAVVVVVLPAPKVEERGAACGCVFDAPRGFLKVAVEKVVDVAMRGFAEAWAGMAEVAVVAEVRGFLAKAVAVWWSFAGATGLTVEVAPVVILGREAMVATARVNGE